MTLRRVRSAIDARDGRTVPCATDGPFVLLFTAHPLLFFLPTFNVHSLFYLLTGDRGLQPSGRISQFEGLCCWSVLCTTHLYPLPSRPFEFFTPPTISHSPPFLILFATNILDRLNHWIAGHSLGGNCSKSLGCVCAPLWIVYACMLRGVSNHFNSNVCCAQARML